MELIHIFGILTTTFLNYNGFFKTVIILVLLFMALWANDEEVGGEIVGYIGIWAGVGAILYSQISIEEAVMGFLQYFILGFVWSVFMYSRVVKHLVIKDKLSKYEKVKSLDYYTKQITVDRIIVWILMFPLSILNFLFERSLSGLVATLKKTKNIYKYWAKHYYEKIGKSKPNYKD